MKYFLFLFLFPPSVFAGTLPPPPGVRDFGKTLTEAGLQYTGGIWFEINKDYRRGDWKGAKPAFWTLTASDGKAKLRLELTKNVSREQAEKTMDERFQRIDALYFGGAAYPGMVTTEFEVPQALRPADIKAGPDGNRAKVLSATPRMSYGAGAEDLVSQKGILGYLFCATDGAKNGTLAQIELFFPKKDFDLKIAREEFRVFNCAEQKAPAGAGGKKK